MHLNHSIAGKSISASAFRPSDIDKKLISLINRFRASYRKKPLTHSPALTQAALAHSQDMALSDFFGHKDTENRVYKFKYRGFSTGENIAAGFTTPETVFDAWKNSPLHRKNLLSGANNQVGFGFYFLETDFGEHNYRYYWTADFGKKF